MASKPEIFLMQEMDSGRRVEFALDEDGKFYIDGKQVVTRDIVQLRWIELTALCITTIAVLTQAIFDVLTYFYK